MGELAGNNLVAAFNDAISNGDKWALGETAWGDDWFDENDTAAPTLVTDGVKLQQPIEFLTILLHPATRTAWEVCVRGWNPVAAAWVPLEPLGTEGVAVSDNSGNIKVALDSAVAQFVAFDVKGVITRIHVQKLTATGGAATAKAYALGG